MEAPGRRHRGCAEEMELLSKTNKRNRDLHGSGRDQKIRSNLAGCWEKGATLWGWDNGGAEKQFFTFLEDSS